jgi:hypothetical protein
MSASGRVKSGACEPGCNIPTFGMNDFNPF